MRLLFITLACSVAVFAEGIRVTSQPGQATVFLDGRFVGATPVTVVGVAPGKHLLELRKHGFEPWKQAVPVRPDGQNFDVELAPLAAGGVRIVSRPSGARVYVDGVLRGRTPVLVEGLEPGAYAVRIELDEWLPWRTTVDIAKEQEAAVEAVLDFSGEAMLLAELKREPHKIVDYYELAHHYALQQDFDKLLDVLAKGLDASVPPDAETDETRRLCQEIQRVCEGQYEFASQEAIDSLRPRVVELLRAAMTRTPRNVQVYWVLGGMLAEKKQYEEALAVYQSAIAAMRTKRGRMYYECVAAGVMYKMGYRLEAAEKYEEAMAAYDEVVKTYPKTSYAATTFTRMAIVARSYLKDPDRALACQRRLIELHPGSDSTPGLLLQVGELLSRTKKDFDGAIELYRAFIRDYPGDDRCAEALLRIADILRTDLARPEDAVREYRKLLADYPRSDLCPDALAGLAQADPALVKEAHGRLLKEFPGSAAAGAAEIDEQRKARRAGADALLVEISPLAAKAIANGERAARYAGYVERYAARGDTERAERYAKYAERYSKPAMAHAEEIMTGCTTLVEQYSEFHHAREAQRHIIGMLADVYQDAEKANEARRAFLRMFPDDDTCPDICYDLASFIFRKQREHEKAVVELKAMIAAYPESDQCPRAQALIASIYSHDNGHFDRDRAIEENLRLIETYPDYDGNAAARTAIGRVYHYRTEPGDDERAAAEYLKVVRDYPYTSSAVANEYRLDQHKAGLQLAELEAEGKVELDPETGRRK